LNKQENKLELMDEALQTDMNVAIKDDINFLQKTSKNLEARYRK